MNIIVNGKTYTLTTTPDHLLAFLEHHQLTQGRFAVEVNGTLVPKNRLDTITLSDGMVVEIVQAVGGG